MKKFLLKFFYLLIFTIIWLELYALGEDSPKKMNPFLTQGAEDYDKAIGAFRQYDTNDCFFLACLIALAEDKEGQDLLLSTIPVENKGKFEVIFPNWKSTPIRLDHQMINNYKMLDANNKKVTPISGDKDIKLLEIAADMAWKKRIKPVGLWDDVSMNAFYMFSNAKQNLIFNRKKATKIAITDIDKYKILPKGTVTEINVDSTDSARKALQEIAEKDQDGLSMVLLDYKKYHAVTIVELNFEKNFFTYIDPAKGTSHLLNSTMDVLIEKIALGIYAINSIEIIAETK